ncbi:Uncharacterized protein dnm_049660 [Desulfonema magnum]|uniref:Uncharacterized protein n=1 Tax=Desulfonema magnum TaxID=45655 RepID=A0A975GPK2_9BACT|nr:Uncharacterized protein dnm_049660 [Desulfonema magnum]
MTGQKNFREILRTRKRRNFVTGICYKNGMIRKAIQSLSYQSRSYNKSLYST